MSDMFEKTAFGENIHEYTVSDLSGSVKRIVEREFSRLRVRGEIGRVSRPRSGHVYLDIKDDRAVLAGVIWKTTAWNLAVQPEEGMEMVATGRLTTFPGQSRYQIVIEDLKPAGVGAMMAMLEKRRMQLEKEGLFAQERKKKLPYLPDVIGVVTSPSGAVIRDILHRLRDRFPRQVLIWPVAVQGEKCSAEVSRAIEGFNKLDGAGPIPRPDLLIVARGGGSIEDLWGFNEELVVRAAAASDIPLIAAVGHETDTTLIDYAADVRAPTPTAAAELAVPVRLDLLTRLGAFEGRLVQALSGRVLARGQRLRDISRALPRPDTLLEGPRQKIDTASARLPAALSASVKDRRVNLYRSTGTLQPGLLRHAVESEKGRFKGLSARLRANALERDIERRGTALSGLSKRFARAHELQIKKCRDRVEGVGRLLQSTGHKATLKRGFALVRKDGVLVTSKALAASATKLEIEFSDGRLTVGG
ncbi:MAG: exodeoxyribonuclease VII large subunit [Roseovarius sp.]|nr:exodeoxyribonuclease VII large subunit [Roseovarius sp.]